MQATDDDKAEREREDERKLVYYQDSDGMWVIHAKLPPEQGALGGAAPGIDAGTCVTRWRGEVRLSSIDAPERSQTCGRHPATCLENILE